jgi:hypothetical protein
MSNGGDLFVFVYGTGDAEYKGSAVTVLVHLVPGEAFSLVFELNGHSD